jgi:hypothetical protein
VRVQKRLMFCDTQRDGKRLNGREAKGQAAAWCELERWVGSNGEG